MTAVCSVTDCDRPHSCRGFCNAHYLRWRNYGSPAGGTRAVGAAPSPVCEADGCTAKPRSTFAKFCEMHYSRMYRNGHLDLLGIEPVTEHSGGYLLVYDPSHPLTTRGQVRIYEHRKVFYNHKGRGPFLCHVCTSAVTWADMHVDHLDDDPKNNDIDNLAPACPTCNQWRGKEKMQKTHRLKGKIITAFGETLCVAEWSKKTGLPRSTLSRRLNEGWQAERALREPSGRTGRNAERRARSR